MKTTEKILCYQVGALEPWITKKTGYWIHPWHKLVDVFPVDKSLWMERDQIETDETIKQLIPFICITRKNGSMLFYIRNGKEERLKGKMSIGFGGHITVTDQDPSIHKTIFNCVERELQEELGIDLVSLPSFQYCGIINSEENAVSRVHIGAVILISVNDDFVYHQKEECKKIQWMRLDHLVLPENTEFDAWSPLAISLLSSIL